MLTRGVCFENVLVEEYESVKIPNSSYAFLISFSVVLFSVIFYLGSLQGITKC